MIHRISIPKILLILYISSKKRARIISVLTSRKEECLYLTILAAAVTAATLLTATLSGRAAAKLVLIFLV